MTIRGNTRHRIRAAVAAALLGVAALATAAPAQAAPLPTVVLVHGAFADSSGWTEVAARLGADGYPVRAFDNPLRGPTGDSAELTEFLAGSAAVATNLEPTGTPSWAGTPSWCLVSGQDPVIPPALQRDTAARVAPGRTREVPASHASYVSQPDAVADIIRAAATGSA